MLIPEQLLYVTWHYLRPFANQMNSNFFLDHYYNYTFIPSYDDPFEPSLITGHCVGHPSGNICTIGYKTSNPCVHELLQSYDDPMYSVFIQRKPLDIHSDHTNATPNWSTIELDQPYAFCTSCDELIYPLPPPSLCSSCLNKSNLQKMFNTRTLT